MSTDVLPTSTPDPNDKSTWPPLWRQARGRRQNKYLSAEDFVRLMLTKDGKLLPDIESRNAEEASILLAVQNTELELPAVLRPAFRKRVRELLETLSKKANVVIIKPLVEQFVLLEFTAREVHIRLRRNKDYNEKDVKAFDTMLLRLQAMLKEFEQTPKEMRLSKDKTETTIDELVGRAWKQGEVLRDQLPELRAEEDRVFLPQAPQVNSGETPDA